MLLAPFSIFACAEEAEMSASQQPVAMPSGMVPQSTSAESGDQEVLEVLPYVKKEDGKLYTPACAEGALFYGQNLCSEVKGRLAGKTVEILYDEEWQLATFQKQNGISADKRVTKDTAFPGGPEDVIVVVI
jgi:hypothetical protein